MALDSEDLKVLGPAIAARLKEIEAEAAGLRQMLAKVGGRKTAATKQVAAKGGGRKRKPMSPAQKRAVSLRMKRYWKQRRAAKG